MQFYPTTRKQYLNIWHSDDYQIDEYMGFFFFFIIITFYNYTHKKMTIQKVIPEM